jgi:alginate O-acetyltransferase complex protein AlgJ
VPADPLSTPSATPARSLAPGAEWRLHPVWERVVIACFLTVLAAPGLATLAGVDAGVTRDENRNLAPPPDLAPTWSALAAFPAAFTSYFQDHFAFRARLVRWQAALRLLVLNVSPSPTVIRGQDGWLFYADDGALDDYLNAVPLSAADLAHWTSTLQHTQDWLEARGIAYLFVVAPDKHEIYPEFMPDTIRRHAGPTRSDQLVGHLRARSTVPVLDLRPALLEAKRDARIYHRTDSHWNDLGAFVASQQILGRLHELTGGRMPELAPPQAGAFDRRTGRASGQDLARMLGLEGWVSEDDLQMRPRQPLARTVEPPDADPDFDDGRLVTAVARAGLPRAVVYRDSFGSALVPFLSQHFSRALYLWEYDVDPRVIEQERPQVVIHQWAGRRLSTRLPYDAFAVRPPASAAAAAAAPWGRSSRPAAQQAAQQ